MTKHTQTTLSFSRPKPPPKTHKINPLVSKGSVDESDPCSSSIDDQVLPKLRAEKINPKQDFDETLTNNAQKLFEFLHGKFPQQQHRIRNYHGNTFVQRKCGSKWTRVCQHNGYAATCPNQQCLQNYMQGKDVVKKKVYKQRQAPVPLPVRTHEDAPVIPLESKMLVYMQKEWPKIMKRAESTTNETLDQDCLTLNGSCDDLKRASWPLLGGGYTLLHRFAWSLHNQQQIPDGFVVRHICKSDVAGHGCFQPTHLAIGTHEQNMFEDKIKDGTLPYGEKHHFAKTSNAKALAIYKSKGQGTRLQRAQRFGCSTFIVKKIDTGETFSHVTGHNKAAIKRRLCRKKRASKRPRDAMTKADYEHAMKILENKSVDVLYNRYNCIEANGCKTTDGYTICHIGPHQTRAHILSCEYHHNNCQRIPKGKLVMHACDNRACHNPDHLSIGDHSENQKKRHMEARKR